MVYLLDADSGHPVRQSKCWDERGTCVRTVFAHDTFAWYGIPGTFLFPLFFPFPCDPPAFFCLVNAFANENPFLGGN